MGGLNFATEKDVVERVLARRPGVRSVEANPVSQTATIRYTRQAAASKRSAAAASYPGEAAAEVRVDG